MVCSVEKRMPSTVRHRPATCAKPGPASPPHAGIFFWRLDFDVVKRLRLFKNATCGFRLRVS
ncbi:hypothetical protein AVM02_09620 [Brucella anthropi]